MHNLSPLGVGPGNVGLLFAGFVKRAWFLFLFSYFAGKIVEIAGINRRGIQH